MFCLIFFGIFDDFSKCRTPPKALQNFEKIIKYVPQKMKKSLVQLALKTQFSADSEYPRISDFGYPIRHFNKPSLSQQFNLASPSRANS